MKTPSDKFRFPRVLTRVGQRATGRILTFDPERGRGTIRSTSGQKVNFRFRDVTNINPEEIKPGLRVLYEYEHTHRGVRARDISIYMPMEDVYPYPLGDPDEVEYEDKRPLEISESTPAPEEEKLSEDTSLKPDIIGLALTGDGVIKLVSLAEDATFKYLDERDRYHNLLYTISSDTLTLEMAVKELESLMNDHKAKEREFQEFFERNPGFILNDDYKEAHPHIVLGQDHAGPLIPDFLLEPIDQSSLCDLLELKLPSAEIFVLKKNRPRFSSAVAEAAAQLRAYSRFFDDEKNRRTFEAAYPQLKAYKPRMIVVIGRRSNASAMLQREIQSASPDLLLHTYDQVLERMRWKVDQMRRGNLRF